MHSPTKESPPVYKKEETKGSKNITPPTSFNGQLPSPESLGRKESRARPGQFLKAPTHSDSALEVFRRCLETGQIPWQEFKVRREDYVEVIGLIVGDERLRRFRPR